MCFLLSVSFFFRRDSLLIAVMNSVTSILAGFAIFSIVGYMAHETGQNVDSVVSQGIELIRKLTAVTRHVCICRELKRILLPVTAKVSLRRLLHVFKHSFAACSSQVVIFQIGCKRVKLKGDKGQLILAEPWCLLLHVVEVYEQVPSKSILLSACTLTV